MPKIRWGLNGSFQNYRFELWLSNSIELSSLSCSLPFSAPPPPPFSRSVLQHCVERKALNEEIKDLENPLNFCTNSDQNYTPQIHLYTRNHDVCYIFTSLPQKSAPLHTFPNTFTCTTKGIIRGDGAVRMNVKWKMSVEPHPCWVARASKWPLGGSFKGALCWHAIKRSDPSFPLCFFPLPCLCQYSLLGEQFGAEMNPGSSLVPFSPDGFSDPFCCTSNTSNGTKAAFAL